MENPTGTPTPATPKTRGWLWVILIIVILALAGFLAWKYYFAAGSQTANVTSSPSTEQKIDEDLTATESDLNSLDDNFNQLDKIDSTEDTAPTL